MTDPVAVMDLAITGLTGFDVGTWKPSPRTELSQTR